MINVCLYFKVHQPYRLIKYEAKDIDAGHGYEDVAADRECINQLADQCCLPANEIIYDLLAEQKGKFKISFSISGVVLELFQRYRPDVIRSFKKLAATGCIEFLAETYYHSLTSLYSGGEFKRQVQKHSTLIKNLFSCEPSVFKNTELIHNNRIASLVTELGLKGILCEGVERILKGRTCNKVYAIPGLDEPALLLRNATLSDDIAFRFGDTNWSEHPLTAGKFAEWLHQHRQENTDVINLLMDYETFGIYKQPATGIFEFLKSLPATVLNKEGFCFSTPSEVLDRYYPKDVYDVSQTISWEDQSNGSVAWCENVMQNNTLKKIYSIQKLVMQSPDDKDADTWGRLQAADYFYYMADDSRKQKMNKGSGSFGSAREVFQHYTNLVADFEITLIRKAIAQKKSNSSRHIPFNILSN